MAEDSDGLARRRTAQKDTLLSVRLVLARSGGVRKRTRLVGPSIRSLRIRRKEGQLSLTGFFRHRAVSGGFNPNANTFNPNAGSFVPGGAPPFQPGQPYNPYGAPPQQGGNPADYYNQYAGGYGGYGGAYRS